MSKNVQYAQMLREMGYEKVIAFKLLDKVPENAEPYGDDVSFHCAMAAEALEEGRKPFYITNKNVLCGGALYSGIGNRKTMKEEFDGGMSQTIGVGKGYSTREVFRKINQQIPHRFIHHKYQVIGKLEDVEDPDVVMVVADAHKTMRLCKAYTWKTGDLVQGLSGSAWCTCSFPHVLKNKTMSFATGDEQSRNLMNLEPGELTCLIHYEVLPIVLENYKNIQTGMIMV